MKKGQLFSDDNPDYTIKGTGFKDKETAINTLKIVKGRDLTYQFQVINTMYYRGKEVFKNTKDLKKKQNIKKALDIYKKWLDDYKTQDHIKWKYLPLDVINKMECLAEYYNISRKARGLEKPTKSDNGFLKVYREHKGDIKKLRILPIKKTNKTGQTWDKHRVAFCNSRMSLINKKKLSLYKDGLPSKTHTNLIMWGCTPDYKNIIKLSKTIKTKLKYSKKTKKHKSSRSK